MKTFITLLTLLSQLLVSVSFAAVSPGKPGLKLPSDVQALLNYPSPEAFRSAQIGTQLVQKKAWVMLATYDFSKVGGAVGTINLRDVDQKDAVLPKGAIVKRVTIHMLTNPTSGGAATVALGINTTTDLLAATAYNAAPFSNATGVLGAGIPVGTAATMVRVSAQSVLTATVATAALTAGKFEVFVEYYLGN